MNQRRFIILLVFLALLVGWMGPVSLHPSAASASSKSSLMRVRAYPFKAVTSRQDVQTIDVIVQDDNLMPVMGAEVSIRVQMPDGSERLYIAGEPTSFTGITQTSFPVSSERVGLVIVEVTAARNRVEARTSTSFRIWW